MNLPSSNSRLSRTACVLLACAGSLLNASCRPAAAEKTPSGQTLFASCVNCHGQQGQGNASLAAPAIAGLPQWYLEAQLKKFRTGTRAYHPDDIEGLRMRPMTRQLANDAEFKAVAEYVAMLPHLETAPALGGDAAAGQTAYATCAACHGADGRGNHALKAPPLAGQPDWYLASQLNKFRKGHRGTHKDDVTGQQMRPMSLTLADDQAIRNVVAHISTLKRK